MSPPSGVPYVIDGIRELTFNETLVLVEEFARETKPRTRRPMVTFCRNPRPLGHRRPGGDMKAWPALMMKMMNDPHGMFPIRDWDPTGCSVRLQNRIEGPALVVTPPLYRRWMVTEEAADSPLPKDLAKVSGEPEPKKELQWELDTPAGTAAGTAEVPAPAGRLIVGSTDYWYALRAGVLRPRPMDERKARRLRQEIQELFARGILVAVRPCSRYGPAAVAPGDETLARAGLPSLVG
jgi:hypothetical protein